MLFTQEQSVTTTPIVPPEVEAALRLLAINISGCGAADEVEAKGDAFRLLRRYFAGWPSEPEKDPAP